MDGLHQQVILAFNGPAAQAEGALLHQGVDAHGGQHAAKAGSAWAMEKVATFYEEGYGCTANRALADACRETLKYMR